MKTSHRSRRTIYRRRGIQTLELLFAVPILFALLGAALVYERMLIVESGVTQASIAGAREAGKGASVDEVTGVVNHVLAAYGVAINDRSGSIVVERGGDLAAACGEACAPATPPTGPQEVRVTVCVTLGAGKAAAKGPGILDSLASFLHGKRLCASSLVSQEGPRG